MIVNSQSVGSPRYLAAHLQKTHDGQRVEILEFRHTATLDMEEALVDMQAMTIGTAGWKGLFHANIDPAAEYCASMREEDWLYSADAFEQRHGLEGQPRILVIHEKADGRRHLHGVWGRVDAETLKFHSDSWNYRKNEEVARHLEQSFGHAPVKGIFTGRENDAQDRDGRYAGDRPGDAYSHAQWQQGEKIKARGGLDAKERKAQITELWTQSPSGQAFVDGLQQQGYTLAKGDKAGVHMIVDQEGEAYRLRQLLNKTAKVKDIKEKLASYDLDALPGVADVKRRQEAQRQEAEQVQGWEARADRDERLQDDFRRTANDNRAQVDSIETEREGDETSRVRAKASVVERYNALRRAFEAAQRQKMETFNMAERAQAAAVAAQQRTLDRLEEMRRQAERHEEDAREKHGWYEDVPADALKRKPERDIEKAAMNALADAFINQALREEERDRAAAQEEARRRATTTPEQRYAQDRKGLEQRAEERKVYWQIDRLQTAQAEARRQVEARQGWLFKWVFRGQLREAEADHTAASMGLANARRGFEADIKAIYKNHPQEIDNQLRKHGYDPPERTPEANPQAREAKSPEREAATDNIRRPEAEQSTGRDSPTSQTRQAEPVQPTAEASKPQAQEVAQSNTAHDARDDVADALAQRRERAQARRTAGRDFNARSVPDNDNVEQMLAQRRQAAHEHGQDQDHGLER